MRRKDGRLLKSLNPFDKLIPFIMETRNDAQNICKQRVPVDTLKKYIKEKNKEGYKITYLHFFIALYVRLLALRPKLNRFVINNRIFARDGIFVSLAIKKDLTDDGEETTVKFSFEGTESIFEIAKIIDTEINESNKKSIDNRTDHLVKMIMSLPNCLIGSAVRFMKFLDKKGMLPQSVIDVSPFHTSLFFTYLKSINLDYIYHHLYNIGTTGIFVALGKDKMVPCVDKKEVVVKRCCDIGYTMDERLCDGIYFSNSLKLIRKIIANPYLLDEGLEEIVKDVD